jgi:predicted membrane protein
MTSGNRPAGRITAQAVVGIGIVTWGLLLTAANVGWLDIRQIWRYWPLIIVAAGVARFFNCTTASGRVMGTIITFVGVWWLADNFDLVSVHVWDWWPLLFVLMGVMLIVRSRPTLRLDRDGLTTTDEVISAFAFWSGVRRRVASTMFKRADLTAVMGGIELDLRGAATASGEAVIDVFAMWGGIELRVPPDWSVSNQAMAIMGGVDDKSAATADARHRLIVRGFVVMGGVEIKT